MLPEFQKGSGIDIADIEEKPPATIEEATKSPLQQQTQLQHSTSLMCDKIQNPCDGPFDSSLLIWHDDQSNYAWLVTKRLPDLIEGENYRENFNTSFTIRGCHEYSAGEGVVRRTHIHYRCAYGPRNLRGQAMIELPTSRKSSFGRKYLQCKTLLGLS